jgi:hypothetical protein
MNNPQKTLIPPKNLGRARCIAMNGNETRVIEIIALLGFFGNSPSGYIISDIQV